MSKNIDQIYIVNPTTTFQATDLMYLGRSPYGSSSDFAFTYQSLSGSIVSTAVPLTTKGDLLGYSTVPARIPVGSVDGQILQVSSSAGVGIAWSTATYPVTTTINQLLFSSSANTISGLATGNNGTLITNGAGVPSISSTLPSAVQGNITSLGTISSGTWNGSIIGGTYGGTGINNGSNTITLGGNILTAGSLTTVGAFATTFNFTAPTNVTFPTSGTLANTASIPSLPISLTNGGTGASLTASNGGIVYSGSSAFAVLAGNANANRVLLSGAASAPSWSNASYPTSTTVNQILYSSSTNLISGLSSSSNSVLVTDITGVPSFSSSLPSAVQGNITSLGTITSGVWNGTPVTVSFGGTGDSSFTPYTVICGGTTSTGALQNVSGVGANGQIFTSNGAGQLPSWQNAAASGTVNSGTINNLAYYAANGSAVSGLATANNGILITSNTGVPSISSTLPSAVQGNITSVGTLSSGTWNGSVIAGQYGGTGVNNSGKTITLGGNFTTSGASNLTFTLSGATNLTLPTSGTVATTANTVASVKIQTFTASGTYTPSTGMIYCDVQGVGGGGGSGGQAGAGGGTAAAGGGASGGYFRKIFTSANIGASATVTIGAGGTAGATGANAGGGGGATSFVPAGTGSTLTGNGGNGSAGANSTGSSGVIGGALGGSASGGDINISGGSGAVGLVVNGASGVAIGGSGGGNPLGVPSNSRSTAVPTGQANNYGGGASGQSLVGAGNQVGVAGAGGIVIVIEYCNQ